MLFMNKEEILNFRKNNNLTDVTVVATFKLEEVESVEVEHWYRLGIWIGTDVIILYDNIY